MWWLWSPFKLASCQLTSRDIWLTTHHWAFAVDAVTWSPTVFYKLCCMKEIAFWSCINLRCKCRPNIMSNLHIAGQLYKCVTVVVLWLVTGRTEALQLLQETAVCTRVQSVQQGHVTPGTVEDSYQMSQVTASPKLIEKMLSLLKVTSANS